MHLAPAGDRLEDDGAGARARGILADAVALDRAGRSRRAEAALAEAAEMGRLVGDRLIESEAHRRLAVIRHHAGDRVDAGRHGNAALAAARAAADLAAEAHCLNVLGGIALELGDLEEARTAFVAARHLAVPDALIGRIEQNLGIVADVAGDSAAALQHYGCALRAFGRAGDDHGVAIAHHNLGKLSFTRGEFGLAERYFDRALGAAVRVADLRLEGLCHLNRAEARLSQGRPEAAWDDVERAQALFSQLGSLVEEAEVYRLFGAVFRHLGRDGTAEANLLAACEHARRTGAVLTEAASHRELARLRLDQGRTTEAIEAYRRAGTLFDRIGARGEGAEIDACLATVGASP